ncbi:eCIS core domain-containing protein [Portibacter lacus]|uniref:eCIS core domain-containing protein n=1 Tax=Portibacter lacus TaxID=1099794 RepID=A0AA37WFB4_9BACT|nr:DUF4157 domain-containing protein [Portibacter lacus]GLR18372.1 hypothetical protein GCM10007940_29880 [Portibacter lacus]
MEKLDVQKSEFNRSSADHQTNSQPEVATEMRTPPPLQFKIEESEQNELSSSEPDQLIANGAEDNPTENAENPEDNFPNDARGSDIIGQMESSFGQDFSNVNFIQNSQSALSIGARAFARGEEIHFAPGEFNPSTSRGRQLIGHELTHVIQQRQGRVSPTRQLKGFQLNDNSTLEQEADDLGEKASRGQKLNIEPFQLKSRGTVIQGDLLGMITGESQEEYNERRQRSLHENQETTSENLALRQEQPDQWLVAFDIAGEQHIIREYNSSHEIVTDSTYVNNRNFYRVGDVILSSSFTPAWLRRIFPGIDELIGEEQETTYWDVLGAYLDSHYGERKIGWKISAINTSNNESGEGTVSLQAVLFISENEAVSIPGRNGTRSRNRDSLHNDFSTNASFAFLTNAMDVIAVVTDFCVGLISGSIGLNVIRRSLGAAGLRLLPNVLRGPILRIVRFLGGSIAATSARVANKVIRDIGAQEENNQIRERAGVDQQEMHYEDIITDVLISELTSVISGRFTNFLNERISSGLSEALPAYLHQSLGTKVKTFIAQQIASGLGRGLHLGSAITAARRRASRGENYNQALEAEVTSKLAPVLSNPSNTASSILGNFVTTITASE